MSQKNVEIIRKFVEAFNREDFSACLEAIDPNVEWHPPPDIPNAAVASGRDALIANFQDWLGAWDEYRSIPEEIIEGKDDTVLVFARESGRGKDSGIEVTRRIMFMVDDVDDVVTRLRSHGAELVGEIAQYEDIYRRCFVRGPEGIIIGLSEQLS